MTETSSLPQAQIEQLVAAYFTAMAAMSPTGWIEIFAPDATIYDPVGTPATNPHQDSEKFFTMLTTFFAQLQLSQDHVFVVGNSAAVQWTMTVTGKNGRSAETGGISTFEINPAGKIQTVSSYWDETALAAQLRG